MSVADDNRGKTYFRCRERARLFRRPVVEPDLGTFHPDDARKFVDGIQLGSLRAPGPRNRGELTVIGHGEDIRPHKC